MLISVKDFDHFVDRSIGGTFTQFGQSKTDMVWNNFMGTLKGDKWRHARSTFTPIFTSGKMKLMMSLVEQTCSSAMDSRMGKASDTNSLVELRDLCGEYSMKTIASCAFGLQVNDPKFVQNADNVFKYGLKDGLKIAAYMSPLKHIINALKLSVMKPTETEFFIEIIKQTLKQRRDTGMRRNDLVDLMLAALRREINNDSDLSGDEAGPDTAMKEGQTPVMTLQEEEDMIIANAMAILVAGYDTTGNTLAFLLLELARNQEIQDRLRAEIDNAIDEGEADNNGRLPYSVIQGLEYLDMVINEGLRKYPAGALGVARLCTKDYTLPGTDLTITKGQEVQMSAYGIHFDERHYPNPSEFDPERFAKEAKAKRHPMAFLTFGQGPRSCIGMRFALLEMKVALANIIRDFRITTCAESPSDEEVKLVRGSLTMTAATPLLVKVERRSY